jgi:HSP20 family protein
MPQYVGPWRLIADPSRARILQKDEAEMLSKSSNKEIDVPGWGGLSWARFDEMFHDGEGRRSFKIEECHDGDTMIVRAELPGVNPEKDVQVEVVDGELMISAHRTETHKTTGHHMHRSEFRYGAFTRSIPLPPGVDESKIEASYKDGVLEVRLQVPQQSSDMPSRRIQIKRS